MDAQLPLMYHHVRPYYIQMYLPAELKQTTEAPAISKCSNQHVIDFILNHCLIVFLNQGTLLNLVFQAISTGDVAGL